MWGQTFAIWWASGPFPGWKCNFDHFLGEVWEKIIFSMILNDLKPSVYGENTKKMKVHSVKKRIHENRLYYEDFDQKQIFQKKRSKLILDMRCRRCVSYIRHVFFINTDVWALSQKNLSRFKEPFWWLFIIYLLLLSYRMVFIKIEDFAVILM